MIDDAQDRWSFHPVADIAIHVIPDCDTHEHVTNMSCHCSPSAETFRGAGDHRREYRVATHFAADHREGRVEARAVAVLVARGVE